MAPFVRPHSRNHPLNTNLPVYYTNSTFIVSTIVSQQLVQIVFTGFCLGIINIFTHSYIIFSNSTFIFITHFFVGLRELNYVNPGSFSLFVHSLICPITHSFLYGFQPNWVQHFPHVCFTCHTVFSLKNTLECICERLC